MPGDSGGFIIFLSLRNFNSEYFIMIIPSLLLSVLVKVLLVIFPYLILAFAWHSLGKLILIAINKVKVVCFVLLVGPFKFSTRSSLFDLECALKLGGQFEIAYFEGALIGSSAWVCGGNQALQLLREVVQIDTEAREIIELIVVLWVFSLLPKHFTRVLLRSSHGYLPVPGALQLDSFILFFVGIGDDAHRCSSSLNIFCSF